MSELTNGGFEDGADGVATGWDFISSMAASAALPFESFEDGWDNTSMIPALTSAVFGGDEPIELFGRLWGPADGTNANLPDVVPFSLYGENANFVAALAQVAAGPTLDSFDLWDGSIPPYILDFVDLAAEPTPIESFESGWGNAGFVEEHEDGVTITTATFYAFEPQTIENFDAVRIVDGHELISVLLAASGIYTATINGTDFEDAASVPPDNTTVIAARLTSTIDSSTYPYAASVWLGGAEIAVKNLSTSPMLITAKGPANNGSDIKVRTQIYTPNFWFMPLE